ncbi:MAG: ATPase [Alphaproteobacteria bacterium]|nr:ATPase [Alphaproteobacteria bacterium]
MKRFYKQVAVVPADDGFAVHLDGRPIRTPAKAPLLLPTPQLAERVAAEWDGQGEKVRPQDMPMTGLANAAIDLMASRRADVVGDVAAYAGTDLLCYRADSPVELRARQDEGWQPVLDWAADRLGLRFVVTEGIVPVAQEPGLVEAARLHLDTYDDFAMVGVNRLTHGTGSIVLALAVVEGLLTAEEAIALSLVDELWQEALWGVDEEAAERRAMLRQDLLDAAEFLRLARR